ncbi:hypothetical protein JCM6882_003865 [Rhodosporidiobolus microsporus]
MSAPQPQVTTTPTFNQVFAAFAWVAQECEEAHQVTGTQTRPIPIGDFGVACFAYESLKKFGHLSRMPEGMEDASVEHQVRAMQVYMDQSGAAQHLPPKLKEVLKGQMRGNVFYTNIYVPASAPGSQVPTPSPAAFIPAQLHFSHPLVTELVAFPPNLTPLLFQQELKKGLTAWQFAALVLVLLEFLAWDHDRNDRHLLNIKVLFEAEVHMLSGVVPRTHISLMPAAVTHTAPLLNHQALEVVVEMAFLVAHSHADKAARWEWGNVRGLHNVVQFAQLTLGWKRILGEVAHLLRAPHRRSEHSVGKGERRRERRRSFAMGRGGW